MQAGWDGAYQGDSSDRKCRLKLGVPHNGLICFCLLVFLTIAQCPNPLSGASQCSPDLIPILWVHGCLLVLASHPVTLLRLAVKSQVFLIATVVMKYFGGLSPETCGYS